MQESYDFKVVEPKVAQLWDDARCFEPKGSGRPFSMFLIPPNASGPLHVGNALMLAIQDVLARYHRAKGEPTLWVPGTDHGGYETQVTFERELEARGESKDSYSRGALFSAIDAFVQKNISTITAQIRAVGASVDWSHLRYTLDRGSLAYVDRMFSALVDDKLIYRSSYMVNYCPVCATMLADIELKEVEATMPQYVVKFPFKDVEGYVALATTRPEFLFSVTHVLAHPQDPRLAPYIGQRLVNPATGEDVLVVESKRKFDPAKVEPIEPVFMPSFKKYDFEYAIRHKLPARNLLDWQGLMVEHHAGMSPEEARVLEVERLTGLGAIEQVDDTHVEPRYLCKKGHDAATVIRMSWFMRLDDAAHPLRKPALEAIERERLMVYPHWRLKGLTEWIGKMHDWPISRQNVWGIRIPIWYEVTDPALFTVWFVDDEGTSRFGNLAMILREGVSFDDIVAGLERVYAEEGTTWTLDRKEGKRYLPETDTFDTWLSSGAWSVAVFDHKELERFYPSSTVVIGQDLLRLSIARKIILGVYMTGKLPFKRVYFHGLLQSKDGQKMSKSLGNAVTLDEYMGRYGADTTRMALVSYTASFQDFYLADERLEYFANVAERLWQLGQVCNLANTHRVEPAAEHPLTAAARTLRTTVGASLDKFLFAKAQDDAVAFLGECEAYVHALTNNDSAEYAVAGLYAAFKLYLEVLHPFAPFITEELYQTLYRPSKPLAAIETKK